MAYAPKILSGVDVIDEAWGGLYRGGSYLVYGRAATGRGLLTMMFMQTGAMLEERCLFISPDRPKDLMIQAASMGFNLRQAYESELVKLMRIPPMLNLHESGDEGVAKALNDLVSIIRQNRPGRLIINDFMPFVQFRSFERFRAAFVQMLEQIDSLDTTMMLVMAEPANQQSRKVIEFMRNQMTGAVHIELVEADTSSTKRRLTLIPNIGHIRRRVVDFWDLQEVVDEFEDHVSSSLRMLSRGERDVPAAHRRFRFTEETSKLSPRVESGAASPAAGVSRPAGPAVPKRPEPPVRPVSPPTRPERSARIEAPASGHVPPPAAESEDLRPRVQPYQLERLVEGERRAQVPEPLVNPIPLGRRSTAPSPAEAPRPPEPATAEAPGRVQAFRIPPRETTPDVGSAARETAPEPPAYDPAPEPPTYQPAPEPPTYQPAPEPPAYQQAPEPPTYQPAPERPAYEPAPETPTYQPAPEPPDRGTGEAMRAPEGKRIPSREDASTRHREERLYEEPPTHREPAPPVYEKPEHLPIETTTPPPTSHERTSHTDREAFRSRLQQHFLRRDVNETPFLLIAMRMDRSQERTARPFDFEFILDLVSEQLRDLDDMLVDLDGERLIVLLADSRPEAAQHFFAQLKARLRDEAPRQAEHLLHSVSAIVVPDGRPFQNAEEFLTYALDEA